MKNKLILLFLAGMFITSCQKSPDEITIIMNNSGTFTIQVLDEDGNPKPNADVTVSSIETDNIPIYIDSTDGNGICNAGKLLEGEYYYYVQAETDGKKYTESEYFQIITNEAREIQTNPYQNVGTATIKILDSQETEMPGINVALIPDSYHFNNYEFVKFIEDIYNNC